MAIWLRHVNGLLVALCAAETDPKMGDEYLDDAEHYALAAKFARDWRGETINWSYPDEDAAAKTQKMRDAREELVVWQSESELL